jgi:hypothetical protein
MVVNINRHALVAAYVLTMIWAMNRTGAHPLKKTDTTDIPVCLNKNAEQHRTMRGLAAWGHSGKGWFYGLKLGLTTDLFDTMLGIILASGNTDDREMFRNVNKDIYGVIVADAGHISEDLEKEFFIENKRMLMIKPRKNMKKVITAFQYFLYNTRQRIELDIRNLKLFFGLVTSLPRSIDGYFANYLYSILAYVCA